MKDVVVTLTTKSVSIPGANPGDAFSYSILDKDGSPVFTQKTSGKTVTFPNVPVGDYEAVVARFGVEARAVFRVEQDASDMVDVPDSVSVNVVL